jgi:hypothetical protein
MQVTRQVIDANRWQLLGSGAQFDYQRLTPGALLVTISGNDRGQFGATTLDEIRLEILRHQPLELLIDAEEASNVSVEVSRQWTEFFAQSRSQLRRVSVLTGSKLVNLTVAIAQHLSHTGNLIQIYTDRQLFDTAIARANAELLINRIKQL